MSNTITIVAAPHTGFTSVFKLFDKEEYNHIDLDKTVDPDNIKLDETKMNIVFGHIWPESINIIKYLNDMSKIIVPIRDPLLSLISTKTRNVLTNSFAENGKRKFKPVTQNIMGGMMTTGRSVTESSHISASHGGMRRQLFGWELWAKHIYELEPLHIPLGLDISNLTYRGIQFKDIGTHNSKGNSDLKSAYYDRDLPYIKAQLTDNLEALMKMESILRPPLEELGYKDLLWWSS